jgi:3-oxoacyl-[acyl-carrier protein] reductase
MNKNQKTLRSILITGSGSGIGAATALQLARPGTGLVIHARQNEEGCKRIAEDVIKKGAESVVSLGDLSDLEFAKNLVDTAVETFGGLDVLIANAGFPDLHTFNELNQNGLGYCFKAMTVGFFHMATRAIPHLEKAETGRVVTISSHNAHVFRPNYPLFPGSAASKSALEVLTRTLAIQLAPYNVTVNCVVPGFIGPHPEDEMESMYAHVPLGRVGKPDEVAALIAVLVSPDASYITNQIIHVNGGLI